MNIDQILGAYETRYFGIGHKKTNYQILEKVDSQQYRARVQQGSLWSQKENGKQTPHLSTLDGIVLSIIAFQHYYGEVNLEKYYLKSFSVVSGRKAVEDLDSVYIKIASVNVLPDLSIDVKSEIEGMKVNVLFSISTADITQIEEASTGSVDYYSNHLKNRKHQIDNIRFLSDSVVAGIVSREESGNEDYGGVGCEFYDSLSLLEWLIVFSQFAQSLIYYHDDIDRKCSNTLWMKSVQAEMDEPQQYKHSIPLIGVIDKFTQINRPNQKWNIFQMSGSDVSNQIKFSAKLAHLL